MSDEVFNDKTYILSASKSFKSKSSYYNISLGTWDKKNACPRLTDNDLVIGRVKSDFGGL